MRTLTFIFSFVGILVLNMLIYADEFDRAPSWYSADSSFTMTVAAGDMDGDGYCDLVAGNYYYTYPTDILNSTNIADLDTASMGGEIVVYWQDSNGLTTSEDQIWSGDAGVDKIVIADMDNNGDLDIVVGTVVMKGKDGIDFILKNEGSRSFAPDTSNT